jgi:hypothetical protein
VADDEDLEDTVISPVRPLREAPGDLDEDTVVRPRSPYADVPLEALEMFLGKGRAAELLGSAPAEPPVLVEPPARTASPGGSFVPPPERVHAPVSRTPVFDATGDLAVYSFRIGDQEPIPLDVPAYVGRRPTSPRIPGGRFPRLVKVVSPLREVSGTHVEVRQHGASVVVTDLKSTNGTIVLMPGATPLKLRQGESVVVLPGTVVDIGDGNILEILPIRRAPAPPGDAAGERRHQ